MLKRLVPFRMTTVSPNVSIDSKLEMLTEFLMPLAHRKEELSTG